MCLPGSLRRILSEYYSIKPLAIENVRVFVVFAFLFILGCSPSPDSLKSKLVLRAKTDLQDILDDLHVRGLDSLKMETPTFEIIEFQIFEGDTARMFQAYAKINFIYLSGQKLIQQRKYRYNSGAHFWDRYDIKLKHIPAPEKSDSLASPSVSG